MRKSGLIEQRQGIDADEAEVEAQWSRFCSSTCPPAISPMCGNSVHQDRRFLARYMPRWKRISITAIST